MDQDHSFSIRQVHLKVLKEDNNRKLLWRTALHRLKDKYNKYYQGADFVFDHIATTLFVVALFEVTNVGRIAVDGEKGSLTLIIQLIYAVPFNFV